MKRFGLPILGFISLACAGEQGRGVLPGPGRAATGECPCARGKERASMVVQDPGVLPSGVIPPELDHGRAAVPVTFADPSWGSVDAPVTIVEFSDFECPFCSRVAETMEELKQLYGPAQLRLVWKNMPLPFHASARPAAEAATTVFALGGSAAFFRFHDLLFANQRSLSAENFVAWAGQAGVDRSRFRAALAAGRQKAKVDDDLLLARRLDTRGTPVFRINGVELSGAQPSESFRTIIDGQLAAAKELLAAGTAPRGIYPALCNRNVATAAPLPVTDAQPGAEDTTLWSVPVDKDDPVRGPTDAIVTLVLFSEFECPFCRRLESTVSLLMQKYGSDLRIVWKDFPMPFHERAVPAAVLARVALDRKGNQGFWQAHDAILGGNLDRAGLKVIAERFGLPYAEVEKAIADRRYQPVFDRSQALAKRLSVRGTPCAFVNGHRIEGALPAETFVAVIDAELARARDMLEAGHARKGLYAALTNTVEEAEELERKSISEPSKDNPTRGPAKAKVTIQMFGDFQCPHSLKVVSILAELGKKFSGHLRFVWRNYPMAFHEDAALAAEAAQEVFAQKGAVGFWKYHDLLFSAQVKGGLGRDNLEKLARKVGVDGKRLRAALDSRRHQRVVDRDREAVRKAELVDLPAVFVGAYLLAGPQPAETFEGAVMRALAEAEPAR
jgi:protein-disulfide isomerase